MGDAALSRIDYAVESTYATPPGGAYKALRATSDSLAPDNRHERSKEQRPSASSAQNLRLATTSRGEVGFEEHASTVGLKEWKQYALRAASYTAAVAAITPGNISVSVASNETTFTRASGSWTADGFVVGKILGTSGFTSALNNGVWPIKTVGTTTIVVYGAGATEGAAARTVSQFTYAENAKTITTMTIEREYQDNALTVDKFVQFQGQAIQTMALTSGAQRISDLTFGLVGKKEISLAASDASSKASPGTTSPQTMNNLVTFSFGSTISGSLVHFRTLLFRDFEFRLDNQNYLKINANDGATPSGVGIGEQTVSGRLRGYYNDKNIYQNAESFTRISILIAWADASSNLVGYYFPSAKMTNANRSRGGSKTEGVLFDIEWESEEDAAEGINMRVFQS